MGKAKHFVSNMIKAIKDVKDDSSQPTVAMRLTGCINGEKAEALAAKTARSAS
jgi:sulfite reductase beta subunit-like hemoprotein